MKTSEAADLIQSIADSIRNNPNQFNFKVEVVGTKAIAKNGGTGIKVAVTGGQPGSQTIGFKSEVKISKLEIENINKELSEEILEISNEIENVAMELKSKEPNKSRIKKLYESIQNKWTPNLIIAVIGHLLTNSLGI